MFEFLPSHALKIAAHLAASVALLVWIVRESARRFSVAAPWRVFLVVAFFTPFWSSAYIGQVNIFVAAMMFGYFINLDENPARAGAMLAAAVALKVTPGLLLLLTLQRGRWPVLAWFTFTSGVLVVASGLAFGFDHFATYVDVVKSLSSVESYGPRNLSVLNTFYWAAVYFGFDHVAKLQVLVWIAALGVSLLALRRYRRGKSLIPFAIISMALTTAPNLLWEHHFVFLIPAACLLLSAAPCRATGMLCALCSIQIGIAFAPDYLVSLFVQFGVWAGMIAITFSDGYSTRSIAKKQPSACRSIDVSPPEYNMTSK